MSGSSVATTTGRFLLCGITAPAKSKPNAVQKKIKIFVAQVNALHYSGGMKTEHRTKRTDIVAASLGNEMASWLRRCAKKRMTTCSQIIRAALLPQFEARHSDRKRSRP